MEFAIQQNQFDAVKSLVDIANEKEFFSYNYIISNVLELFSHYFTISDIISDALYSSIKLARPEIVEYLINTFPEEEISSSDIARLGIDRYTRDYQCGYYAPISEEDINLLIEFFLNKYPDENLNIFNAVRKTYNYKLTIKLLEINPAYELDKTDSHLIFKAIDMARDGDFTVLDTILSKNVDLNIINTDIKHYEETPLCYATHEAKSYPESTKIVVQKLINARADPKITSKYSNPFRKGNYTFLELAQELGLNWTEDTFGLKEEPIIEKKDSISLDNTQSNIANTIDEDNISIDPIIIKKNSIIPSDTQSNTVNTADEDNIVIDTTNQKPDKPLYSKIIYNIIPPICSALTVTGLRLLLYKTELHNYINNPIAEKITTAALCGAVGALTSLLAFLIIFKEKNSENLKDIAIHTSINLVITSSIIVLSECLKEQIVSNIMPTATKDIIFDISAGVLIALLNVGALYLKDALVEK